MAASRRPLVVDTDSGSASISLLPPRRPTNPAVTSSAARLSSRRRHSSQSRPTPQTTFLLSSERDRRSRLTIQLRNRYGLNFSRQRSALRISEFQYRTIRLQFDELAVGIRLRMASFGTIADLRSNGRPFAGKPPRTHARRRRAITDLACDQAMYGRPSRCESAFAFQRACYIPSTRILNDFDLDAGIIFAVMIPAGLGVSALRFDRACRPGAGLDRDTALSRPAGAVRDLNCFRVHHAPDRSGLGPLSHRPSHFPSRRERARPGIADRTDQECGGDRPAIGDAVLDLTRMPRVDPES